MAEADRALEVPAPDPADRWAAAVHAAATYLAHLARALTMREAQLDRLPVVDDACGTWPGERDSEGLAR